jgi:hypothetical protein
MRHAERPTMLRPAARIISLTLAVLAFALPAGTLHAAPAPDAKPTLWSRPNLPLEKTDVALTFRIPADAKSSTAGPVRFQIADDHGKPVFAQTVPVARRDDSAEATLSWRPPHNGLYHVTASRGADAPLRLDLPVLFAGRALDFVWYRNRPYLRWATVIASAGQDDLPLLHRRGIKALRWMYGSNHDAAKDKAIPVESVGAEAEKYYRVPEGFDCDGYGIDEFGGYPQSVDEQRGLAWLRGLIKAREQFPKGFVVAAWHGGGVRDEWVGLYKQAADLLLLESYEMFYVPHELGTENIFEDLRGRLIAPRGADLLTRAYGSKCKVLLSLDLCGENGTYGDPGETEQVMRFIRREFPEMRGIAFFNVGTEAVERAADRLCFDYFIRPVVTFQHNSLWFDRFAERPQIVAAVSNIGAMDSGAVTVRLKVNGKVIGTQCLGRVPAGSGRLADRALLRWDWRPRQSGVYDLEAQVLAAPGSTVLDGVVRESRWLAADETH